MDAGEGQAGEAGEARTWASNKVEVRPHGDGQALFAAADIAAGERLLALARVFVTTIGRYTIQIDGERHQAGTGEADDYMNHSCEPSARLDFETLEVFAVRPIAAGDLITFNYLSSEWDMVEPFSCECGSSGCLGIIRGFRHLNADQRQALLHLASPYLRGRLAHS